MAAFIYIFFIKTTKRLKWLEFVCFAENLNYSVGNFLQAICQECSRDNNYSQNNQNFIFTIFPTNFVNFSCLFRKIRCKLSTALNFSEDYQKVWGKNAKISILVFVRNVEIETKKSKHQNVLFNKVSIELKIRILLILKLFFVNILWHSFKDGYNLHCPWCRFSELWNNSLC